MPRTSRQLTSPTAGEAVSQSSRVNELQQRLTQSERERDQATQALQRKDHQVNCYEPFKIGWIESLTDTLCAVNNFLFFADWSVTEIEPRVDRREHNSTTTGYSADNGKRRLSNGKSRGERCESTADGRSPKTDDNKPRACGLQPRDQRHKPTADDNEQTPGSATRWTASSGGGRSSSIICNAGRCTKLELCNWHDSLSKVNYWNVFQKHCKIFLFWIWSAFFRVSSCWVTIANSFLITPASVLQSTTFRPGCPSHFQVCNRKRKCQPFYLLVLFLELSGRCGASSRRGCWNVTFSVDWSALFHFFFQSVIITFHTCLYT